MTKAKKKTFSYTITLCCTNCRAVFERKIKPPVCSVRCAGKKGGKARAARYWA